MWIEPDACPRISLRCEGSRQAAVSSRAHGWPRYEAHKTPDRIFQILGGGLRIVVMMRMAVWWW